MEPESFAVSDSLVFYKMEGTYPARKLKIDNGRTIMRE